jgi:hypothetical protein
MGEIKNKNIAVSFDVDLMDYYSNNSFDELDETFYLFKSVFEKYKQVKTTWFMRIDDHIGEVYGESDYIFKRHKEKIEWLNSKGHEIGFHFHSYVNKQGKWEQNKDQKSILEELNRAVMLAKSYNLKGVRMGWAYQTNATIKLLNDAGFLYDASALPRPLYPWEKNQRDWAITGQDNYFPSLLDYRISGDPALKIIEIPISTLPISASTDDMEVIRYISPAYKPSVFKNALVSYARENVITILHPYEAIDKGTKHDLMAFSFDAFEDNIRWLVDNKYTFKTILEMAESTLYNKAKEDFI